MNEQQPPSPGGRDPAQAVNAFLDVFAGWLADDARPTISAQTARLRTLAPSLRGGPDVGAVVRHLEDLLGQLDHLGDAIAARCATATGPDVESLASAAADRCSEACASMARTRWLLAGRADEASSPSPADGCRTGPD